MNPTLQRTMGLMRGTLRQSERLGRRLTSQSLGLVKRARHLRPSPKQGMDDVTLARKVETEIFRREDAPNGSVDVNAVDGVVYLRGEVKRPAQIKKLEAQTRAIPEVRDVENLLHLPKTPAPTRADTPRPAQRTGTAKTKAASRTRGTAGAKTNQSARRAAAKRVAEQSPEERRAEDRPPTGFPEPPGRDPGDRSHDPDPHHALNTPVGEPDPTEWPDPYEKRPDPRDPPDPDQAPFGEEPHSPPGAISTSEPHPSQDPEAEPWEGPKRDKLDD